MLFYVLLSWTTTYRDFRKDWCRKLRNLANYQFKQTFVQQHLLTRAAKEVVEFPGWSNRYRFRGYWRMFEIVPIRRFLHSWRTRRALTSLMKVLLSRQRNGFYCVYLEELSPLLGSKFSQKEGNLSVVEVGWTKTTLTMGWKKKRLGWSNRCTKILRHGQNNDEYA